MTTFNTNGNPERLASDQNSNPNNESRDASGNVISTPDTRLSNGPSFSSIASGLEDLDAQISAFQNSPGNMSSEDQAELDIIQGKVKVLITQYASYNTADRRVSASGVAPDQNAPGYDRNISAPGYPSRQGDRFDRSPIGVPPHSAEILTPIKNPVSVVVAPSVAERNQ